MDSICLGVRMGFCPCSSICRLVRINSTRNLPTCLTSRHFPSNFQICPFSRLVSFGGAARRDFIRSHTTPNPGYCQLVASEMDPLKEPKDTEFRISRD